MTLREKVAEIEPDKISVEQYGGVRGCPECYDYLNAKDFCIFCEGHSESTCAECWNREFKEDKNTMKYKTGDELVTRAQIIDVTTDGKCLIRFGNRVDWLSESAIDKFFRKDMTAQEAWEIARKIGARSGYTLEQLESVFEGAYSIQDVFEQYATPQKAADKIKEWEESKEIKVGDVVEVGRELGVVLGKNRCEVDGIRIDVLWKSGDVGSVLIETLKKTGRHIDIRSILDQIRGE